MDTYNKIEIAEGLINSGKYQNAIDYLTEMLLNNSMDFEALILRGKAFFWSLEIEKAISDLTNAIKINKKAAMAYWYLAQIYSSRNNFIKAKVYIIEAHKIDKENLQFIGDYAIIEQNIGEYQKSIELCNMILAYYPADTFSLFNRGYNYLCLKLYLDAIKDFERLLIEKPDHFSALNNLGYALSLIGSHNKAYKYLQSAIKIEPRFAYPYNNLGYVYYLDNDYNLALKYINQSIDLDPSNSLAYKNRALVYISLNDKEKAKLDLIQAIELGYSKDYDNEVEELIKNM